MFLAETGMKENNVQQRIKIMLEMQDAMNTRVHPEWRGQGFEWYRAIWIECAELLDHYGWKWWKQQTPDIEQVKLELVDIWHFGLSAMLLGQPDNIRLAEELAVSFSCAQPGVEFRAGLETFAAHTLVNKTFDAGGFATLLTEVDLTFDELYTRYIGKNVLNFFRQDHGYQDGSYRKVWAGREDNEHLVEVVAQLDTVDPLFRENLYRALTERYRQQK